MVINPPKYVQQLKAEGLDRYQIADYFKEEINNIFRTEFKDKNANE